MRGAMRPPGSLDTHPCIPSDPLQKAAPKQGVSQGEQSPHHSVAVWCVRCTRLRTRMEPGYPMRYQFVMDLIEEMTLCK